jgi:4-hydroxy-2-oxoheptanedioate aldolase
MPELRSILRNHLKEKLARGEVTASMTVRLCRSIEIAQIARTAGFDTLYVDMEHNTLSIDTTCQICIFAQQIGITPLVRVPANSPEYVCRTLDGGAMGVITPHIRSADEAREMVKLVKFAPLGERSAGGALSHYQYRSFPPAETNAAMNDATMLVVMLETVAALERVEEIIAVDGVDMLLVGSNDLCNEMGITGQYDHPRLRDAFARAIAAAAAVGKHVGVGGLASRNDLMTQFVLMGARYISTGTDMAFLQAACVAKAKFVRDIAV